MPRPRIKTRRTRAPRRGTNRRLRSYETHGRHRSSKTNPKKYNPYPILAYGFSGKPRNRLKIKTLRQVEDRRLYNPGGTRAGARLLSGQLHTLEERAPEQKTRLQKHPGSRTGTVLGFKTPNRVAICIRRNIRKQVLHAKKQTGKAGQSKPHYNYYSSISCK